MMNSTRRKWFADGPDGFDPVPSAEPAPAPKPEPPANPTRRDLVSAVVGRATIGTGRRHSARPVRGNRGRWPA
ncbi:hypothetical protein ACI2K4_30750 [Micromonospora sp. NPDC050397]|uniref:hypothetical protein n=1 Tax=Micromonospora sp. NPDC050397 TaxID=3364279 RepID=UPI00384BA655